MVCFNWFDVLTRMVSIQMFTQQTILANKKKSKVLKKSRKPDSYEAPLLFTPSYLPVPLTLSSTTLPGPEHAESISVKKILNPIMDLIRQLNEVDL